MPAAASKPAASPKSADKCDLGTETPSSGGSGSGELRIANRFRLVAKIGAGSFGDIYEGEDVVTGRAVAIKLERVKAKNPLLQYEARLYRVLNQGKGNAPGIPGIHYSGVEGDFRVMVIDLLGPSLEELLGYCGRQFSLATTCMIADQLLHRLEFLHQRAFLHRDLKPENFVMGLGRCAHHVFMIDYGLAKRYRDVRTNAHIPYNTGRPMVGTARYASVNTHIGCEQSRRDDLEGLSIILVYFILGGLPWQGMKAPTRAEKDRLVTEKKIEVKAEQLCKGCHSCFVEFNRYSRNLGFEEEPDYEKIRTWFRDAYVEVEGRPYDWTFDWIKRFGTRQKAGAASAGLSSAAATGSAKLPPGPTKAAA
eukprot:TRINITY_DN2615_c0_g1_i1.p2 TRINITY_DN2615_c0_g1~~TRINITY_DN2615_c0_g1_i1.p2  ORF type:complete len:365 (+),score=109.47 TRINITY_DN2615_c0_g1_i1:77-1171(+)